MTSSAIAGIQARMGSSRLPGKSLAELGGVPLIGRVVERVRAARALDEVFVLTSDDPNDDPLAEWLERQAIPVRRGPLDDVLARYSALVDEFDPDYVVRVTGDCPLVEPSFVDAQLAALAAFDGDHCWVSRPDVEGTLGGQTALSARALRRIATSDDPLDREHVGSFYLRRRPEEFRFVELLVDAGYARPGLRLQVDEASDLEFLRTVFDEFVRDGVPTLLEVLGWLDGRGPAANRDVVESRANRAARKLGRALALEPVGSWRFES